MAKRFIDAENLNYLMCCIYWGEEGNEVYRHTEVALRTDIEQIPTADVAEVRHGKWTLHTDGSGTCSECRKTQKNVWDYDRWQNYCGHCGARMDGDEE